MRVLILITTALALLAAPAIAGIYDPIVEELENGETGGKLAAILTLRIMMIEDREGAKAATSGALQKLLASEHDMVRSNAIYTLGFMRDEKAWVAIAALTTHPDDEDTRSSAIMALFMISHGDPKRNLPFLLGGLSDESFGVQRTSVGRCARLKRLPDELIHPLGKSLEEKHRKLEKEEPGRLEEYRIEIAEVLAGAAERAAPVLGALVAALEDDSVKLRSAVLAALGAIGPAARSAEVALVKLLKDRSILIRRHTAAALASIGPVEKNTARALTKLLAADDEVLCRRAACALESMGPAAATASGALRRALKSKDAELRAAAAKALGAIGPDAKSAVAVLEKLAERDEDEKVREAAKEAMALISR